MSGLDWQKQIYLNGFSGKPPVVPVDPVQLEAAARKRMSGEAFAYIAGGAGLESTVAANRSSFQSVQIVPRVLTDISSHNTSTALLGIKLPAPLFLSPVGVLEL